MPITGWKRWIVSIFLSSSGWPLRCPLGECAPRRSPSESTWCSSIFLLYPQGQQTTRAMERGAYYLPWLSIGPTVFHSPCDTEGVRLLLGGLCSFVLRVNLPHVCPLPAELGHRKGREGREKLWDWLPHAHF